MTVPGNANPLLLRSAAPAAYQVSRSLRFNSADSAYLSRTPASAGNRRTWTFSCWAKWTGGGTLFAASAGNPNPHFSVFWNSDGTIDIQPYDGGYPLTKTTAAKYRDPAAWYHILISVDTTNATASDRVRLYVNGGRVTDFSASLDPSQNYDTYINTTNEHRIGRWVGTYSSYISAYLAEIHFIDGQALTPSSFAETDATTGQWIPKLYSGSFGTNGFKLTFADNSAATAAALGKDAAGSNNWTPNNFSVTAGAGNDSLVDTPTSVSATDTGIGGEIRGNYCTLNPLTAASGFTLSNGNLEISSTSASVPVVLGTIAVNSGKWYWEVTLGSSDAYAGAATITSRTAVAYLGAAAGQFLYNTAGPASSWVNGSSYNYSTASTCSAGDVIGVALNFDANTITFYRNGVSQGTFSSNVLGTDTWAPAFKSNSAGASETFNFGQRAFAYTAPSGFKALCDTNLTAPVIAKPSTVMDVKLYTGNSSSQNITGLGFNPDLVWLKIRNTAGSHGLWDAIRGTGARLDSGSTGAEDSTVGVTAFNSDGFTVGGPYNSSSNTWAAWCFDAGANTVTNNVGSITSSVRANASAGFSIVTYTGTGANASVGHGLNVAPGLLIAKNRSSVTNWIVWHSSFAATDYIALNLTSAKNYAGALSTLFTGVSSTTISIGSDSSVNANNMVIYAFSPVAGYSSMGSFVGNGSNDGPFVYTGHSVRWLLMKNASTSADWYLFDSLRAADYNPREKPLFPNGSYAEQPDNRPIDLLSNGFKIRYGTYNWFNGNGDTIIYCAFAQNPFQYARAR